MNTSLNYHHLRYFFAVAEQGGIKRASEFLKISPPTLSAQVSELESFLETKLFIRENKRMILTEAGRLVRDYAERIFLFGDEMVEVIRRGTVPGIGKVFLGITDGVPKPLASRIIEAALKRASQMRIVIREGQTSELVPALSSHHIDVLITTESMPVAARSYLQSRRIGSFGMKIMATPELVNRFNQLPSLDGFPLLVPSRESSLRLELERWWTALQCQPDIIAEFDDAAAMIDLATSGIAAAPVFEPVVPSIHKHFQLDPLPVQCPIREQLFLVTARRQFYHEGPALLVEEAIKTLAPISLTPPE